MLKYSINNLCDNAAPFKKSVKKQKTFGMALQYNSTPRAENLTEPTGNAKRPQKLKARNASQRILSPGLTDFSMFHFTNIAKPTTQNRENTTRLL